MSHAIGVTPRYAKVVVLVDATNDYLDPEQLLGEGRARAILSVEHLDQSVLPASPLLPPDEGSLMPNYVEAQRAVTHRTLWVVVNTEGGVGAADWRHHARDLPTYGEGDRYFEIEVPNDASVEEITEGMDAFLGDYDLPEGWSQKALPHRPNPHPVPAAAWL